MRWSDKPRKGVAYRWLHHFWVLSFNRNPDLYRVVWWSRYTRPMFYNTRGRGQVGGVIPGAIFFLILWYGAQFTVEFIRSIF